jgi:hypothetical protein
MTKKCLTALALVIIMGVAASAGPHRLNPKPKRTPYTGGPVVISKLVKTKSGYKLKHYVYTVPPWVSTPYKYNYRYNRSRSSFSR